MIVLACCCSLGALRCSLTDTDGLAGVEANASSDGESPVETSAPDGSTDAAAGEVFASGQSGAFGLALFEDRLYWTSAKPGAEVSSCPVAGCVKPTVVASGGAATAMATLGRVYWITTGKKGVSFTLDGGSVSEVATYSPASWVTASAKNVFAVETNGELVVLQGNPPGGTSSFLGFGPTVERAAANADAVAWTSPKTSTVGYCGSGGCNATNSIVAMNEVAIAIALDASLLFWTTTDGRIRSVAHDGAKFTLPIVDVVKGLTEPSAIAPDETAPFLYFATRGTAAASYLDGTIGKVLKSGGAVTVLARGQARPASVLLSDTHVYWANEYDGTIRRAPK